MQIGNRMKVLEGIEVGRKFMPMLPVCIRIDGKTFHNWTKGLGRPFDENLHMCFVSTMAKLVEDTGALVGYTQSDEISLVLYSDKIDSQIYFDGKIQKIVSVIASSATIYFNEAARGHMPEHVESKDPAFFDCRAWQVPSLAEAANTLVWRELDASRNSVQMAARSVFSHKECHKKNTSQLHEMLHEKGINWNDYPDWAKRGTYARKVTKVRGLTDEELARIPEGNRPEPGHTFERSVVETVHLPQISKVPNKVDVLFKGAEPICELLIETS